MTAGTQLNNKLLDHSRNYRTRPSLDDINENILKYFYFTNT